MCIRLASSDGNEDTLHRKASQEQLAPPRKCYDDSASLGGSAHATRAYVVARSSPRRRRRKERTASAVVFEQRPRSRRLGRGEAPRREQSLGQVAEREGDARPPARRPPLGRRG